MFSVGACLWYCADYISPESSVLSGSLSVVLCWLYLPREQCSQWEPVCGTVLTIFPQRAVFSVGACLWYCADYISPESSVLSGSLSVVLCWLYLPREQCSQWEPVCGTVLTISPQRVVFSVGACLWYCADYISPESSVLSGSLSVVLCWLWTYWGGRARSKQDFTEFAGWHDKVCCGRETNSTANRSGLSYFKILPVQYYFNNYYYY